MSLHRRLTVVGIAPYAPGEKISTPFEDIGLRWLFSQASPRSIARYWRDSTGGIVTLDVDVFGWYIVEDAGIANAIAQPDRTAAAEAACDVAASAGVDIGAYDGLAFFIGGRAVNAGGTGVFAGGRLIPTALLDDRGQHNFIAHEIGHVIGLDHSFRPATPAGEYGDPPDIMSARSFGGYPVTFGLEYESIAHIGANAVLWTEAGPGVAMATLWRYTPGFPAPQPWLHVLPPNAPATAVTLVPPWRQGTRLIAMPIGNRWYTAEFRPARFWDRGLRRVPGSTDFSNAPGIVIHRIQNVGTSADGPPFPLLHRVTYVTTIPLPSAGDDDWEDGSFAVRATGVAGSLDEVQVLVGMVLPDTKSATVRAQVTAGIEQRSSDGPVDLILVGPGCGRQTFTATVVDSSATVVIEMSSTGFTAPQFRFSVNGVPVGDWSGRGAPAQAGWVVIPAEVEVPTGYEQNSLQMRSLAASFGLVGNRLTLTFSGGDGRFELQVQATVAHVFFFGGPGEAVTPVTASTTAEVITRTIELPPEAIEAQNQCQRMLGKRLPIPLPGPRDPLPPVVLPDRDWSTLQPRELADALVSLQLLEQVNPRLARAISARAARQLRLTTEALAQTVRRITTQTD